MKDKPNKLVVRGKFARLPRRPHTGRLYPPELFEAALQRAGVGTHPGAPKSADKPPIKEGSS